MERLLLPQAGVDPGALDEVRFVQTMVKRPMKYRLGNVVEPVTLIRRSGTDVLCLDFVLALTSHCQWLHVRVIGMSAVESN